MKRLKQRRATCSIVSYLFIMFFTLSTSSLFARNTVNRPDEVVKNYYNLLVALTPTDYSGSIEDLDQLQAKLIRQSIDYLSAHGVPLSKDKVETSVSVIEQLFLFDESSLIFYTQQPEISENYLFKPPKSIVSDWRSDVNSTAETWYNTYIEPLSSDIKVSGHLAFYGYIFEAIIKNNRAARAAYVENMKFSLRTNVQVSGANIVGYRVFNDGVLARKNRAINL